VNKMRMNVLVIILFALFNFTSGVQCQEITPSRIIAFTKSGSGVSGYVVEIRVGNEDDTLVMLSAKKTVTIPVGDLLKVVVLPREQNGSYFLAGALVGAYVSSLLISTEILAEKFFFSETHYLTGVNSDEIGLLISTSLGFLVGGSIGGLFPSGSDDEVVIDLSGNDDEKKCARTKLYTLCSNESIVRKIHFNVQGAHVFGHVKEEFRNSTGNGPNGAYGLDVSDFNLLRKMQLTYSITKDIEIGGAVQWSGEPRLKTSSFKSLYENYSPDSGGYSTTGYEQSFKVIGYYFIGKYKPFSIKISSKSDIAFGGGIGMAKIDYQRKAGLYKNSYKIINGVYESTPTGNSFHNEVSETMVSAIIFGEYNFYLKEYLTLGITTDYVYFPTKTIPAEPSAYLPKQTLSGNASIGFNFGVHL
jgi:hypothetical protein